MKELGPEARRLLDAAARLDAAPSPIQQRMRQRVLGSIAAGAVTSSALVAKGATVVGTEAATTAATGAATSAVALSGISGFAVAVAVGLGLGTAVMASSGALSPPTVAAVNKVRQVLLVQGTGAKSMSSASGSVLAAPTVTGFRLAEEPELTADSSKAVIATQASPGASGNGSETRAVHLERESQRNATQARALDGRRAGNVSTASAASIAKETTLLGRVQHAIKAGDFPTALDTLERYRSDFPNGALAEEATASHVVALCGIGRLSEGQQMRSEFLRRFSQSPLTTRVKAACMSERGQGSEDQ